MYETQKSPNFHLQKKLKVCLKFRSFNSSRESSSNYHRNELKSSFVVFHPWFEIMLINFADKRMKTSGTAIKFESLRISNDFFCEFKSAYFQLKTQNLVSSIAIGSERTCWSCENSEFIENCEFIRRIWIFQAWEFLRVKFSEFQKIVAAPSNIL